MSQVTGCLCLNIMAEAVVLKRVGIAPLLYKSLRTDLRTTSNALCQILPSSGYLDLRRLNVISYAITRAYG